MADLTPRSRSVSPISQRRSAASFSAFNLRSHPNKPREEVKEAVVLVEPAVTEDDRSKGSRFTSSLFTNTWTAEILAWLLAVISVVLIVAILVVFNNRRLTEWHGRITINTLINFASQFAQICLLIPIASSISQLKWIRYRYSQPLSSVEDFDKASRQPLDALRLLWKHPKWFD